MKKGDRIAVIVDEVFWDKSLKCVPDYNAIDGADGEFYLIDSKCPLPGVGNKTTLELIEPAQKFTFQDVLGDVRPFWKIVEE